MKAEASDAPRYLNDILGITAYAAGTVDIISFAKLGGTLASAMTGIWRFSDFILRVARFAPLPARLLHFVDLSLAPRLLTC